MEGLVPLHEQQVKARFLPVAEEQVLAYLHAERGVDLLAGGHGVHMLVIRARILDPQRVEQVVHRDFPPEAARNVLRPALMQLYLHV